MESNCSDCFWWQGRTVRCAAHSEAKRHESMEKLVKEAIELFNDGLNIGLGWVARAERLIDGDV